MNDLKNDASLNSLLDAIIQGDEEKVFHFLNIKPGLAKGTDSSCTTSLHYAARKDLPVNERIVCRLLDLGANINESNLDDETPLHLASTRGSTNIVEMLISRGAQINDIEDMGNTPLHLACRFGHFKAAEVLLKAGADREIKNEDGLTAFEKARMHGHQGLVDDLIGLEVAKLEKEELTTIVLNVKRDCDNPGNKEDNRRVTKKTRQTL